MFFVFQNLDHLLADSRPQGNLWKNSESFTCSNTVCGYWPISFRFRLLGLGIELSDLRVTPKRPTRRTFSGHIIIKNFNAG